MKYAPVIIPTLCRYEHFVRCVESLKKNTWAKYTDVYIGLDYPSKESHKEGYKKIKEYLNQKFSEFNSFTLFKRKRNFGARKNVDTLREYCSKRYDRYILLEDDIESSPNFLEYMDTMLSEYEKDENVIAVSGYVAPINLVYNEGATAIKQQLQANTWGIGRWVNKFDRIKEELENDALAKKFPEVYKSGKVLNMTDWALWDYLRIMSSGGSLNNGLKRQSDYVMRILLTVEDKYVIIPTISKTRNLGFDGSGLSCPDVDFKPGDIVTSTNYDYSNQPIDNNDSFIMSVDESFDHAINKEIYNQYDVVDAKELNRLKKFAEMYCSHNNAWRKAFDIRTVFVGNVKRVKGYLIRKTN